MRCGMDPYTYLLDVVVGWHPQTTIRLKEFEDILVADEEDEFITRTDAEQNTLLHLAARRGAVSIVKSLIEKEADVTAENKHGDAPLAIAIRHAHPETALTILGVDQFLMGKENEARLRIPSSTAWAMQLRSIASCCGENDAWKQLAGDLCWIGSHLYGADTRFLIDILFWVLIHTKKKSAYGFECILYGIDRIYDGNMTRIRQLLETPHAQDMTLAQVAWALGNRDALNLLRDRTVSIGGDPPIQFGIFMSALRGDLTRLKYWMQRGGQVNATNIHLQGCTPLHICAGRGFLDLVMFLLEAAADCRLTNAAKQTPAEMALANNYDNVYRIILAQQTWQEKRGETKKSTRVFRFPGHLTIELIGCNDLADEDVGFFSFFASGRNYFVECEHNKECVWTSGLVSKERDPRWNNEKFNMWVANLNENIRLKLFQGEGYDDEEKEFIGSLPVRLDAFDHRHFDKVMEIPLHMQASQSDVTSVMLLRFSYQRSAKPEISTLL